MFRQSLRSGRRTHGFLKVTLFFLGFAGASVSARADAGIPDTPAGHTLQAFLDAFDSGDHDRIAAYVKQYDPTNNTDGLVSFSGQTGGFNFVSVVHSAPDRLTFLVHGRGDGVDAFGPCNSRVRHRLRSNG